MKLKHIAGGKLEKRKKENTVAKAFDFSHVSTGILLCISFDFLDILFHELVFLPSKR